MVSAGCLNAGKLSSPNYSPYEDKVTAIDAVGMMCDATEEHANALGALPKSTDMVGTREMDDKAEKTGAECLKKVTE